MSKSWVASHNICAVHSKDFPTLKLRTLRVTQGTRSIDCQVLDECADSDCSGCCTKNAGKNGYLIDMEEATSKRFGVGSGTVTWTCLDCTGPLPPVKAEVNAGGDVVGSTGPGSPTPVVNGGDQGGSAGSGSPTPADTRRTQKTGITKASTQKEKQNLPTSSREA